MSNSISFYIVTLILCQYVSGQKLDISNDTIRFETYNINELRKHELLFAKNQMGLQTHSETGLGGSGLVWHKTTRTSDTIIFHKLDKKNNNPKNPVAVNFDDPFLKLSFFDDYIEGAFLIISDKELLQLKTNRPYFRQSYIDSIHPVDQLIYAVKGKIMRAPADIENFSEIEHLFENPKRIKLNVLNGKKGYEKYGVIGIKGVIELYEKSKKCKREKGNSRK